MTERPEYRKPLPLFTPENERFWEGCRQYELWLRYCNSCSRPYYYPRDVCPKCGSRDVDWKQMSGRGSLHSFAIVHQSPTSAFRDAVPYVVALVELEEGPRMTSNLVGIEPDPAKIKVGMPLEATYDDVTAEVTLPRFKPAG